MKKTVQVAVSERTAQVLQDIADSIGDAVTMATAPLAAEAEAMRQETRKVTRSCENLDAAVIAVNQTCTALGEELTAFTTFEERLTALDDVQSELAERLEGLSDKVTHIQAAQRESHGKHESDLAGLAARTNDLLQLLTDMSTAQAEQRTAVMRLVEFSEWQASEIAHLARPWWQRLFPTHRMKS